MSRLLTFFLCIGLAVSVSQHETMRGNPIRKVVTMLQDMQKSVEAEGEKEKNLFDKFMCYCNNGAGQLENSIETASAQIDSLNGKIAADGAQKSQFEQDIVQHKSDKVTAEKTIKESTAMREKEANDFAASSGESKANIQSMTAALDALKKGLSASLLQTTAGQTLKNVIQHSPAISEIARATLLSFLETGEGGSDQIIGVVSQMKETMESDLKESTAAEEEAKAAFTTLMASKEGEIAAAKKAVEAKTARVGELAVSVAQGKADLEDTADALEEDKKFKANLASSCSTKSAEWDERSKLRAQEVEAISETIEMLNGDDALELFKKTLPSPTALLQVSSRSQEAASILRRLLARSPMHRMNVQSMLIMLKSNSGGFRSVVKMVDDMVAASRKEQAADDKKRDFCLQEILKTEDEVKFQKGDIADFEADIEKKMDIVATFGSEIAAIQKGIEDLDKSVVTATEQRKDEHTEYTATAASNTAAVELINMAKNRMQKFYQPSLYKAPPTTTVEDSPYGFVQVSQHMHADPGAPPETFSGEYKKSEGSTNIIAMMDQMAKDVEMDIKEGKHDEAMAQKDYEQAMKDAATKRTDDTKLMVEKEGAKAEAQVNLQSVRTDHATQRDQLQIVKDKLYDLEINCNNLLTTYEERKKNRADEEESLKQSQAVLQGAAQGFLQK
jgi:hypothetical protein